MKRMHINPARLGAVPCRDVPNCWVLSNSDMQEMTIACTDSDNKLFTVTIRMAKLLPDAQAYQLAAALMLNSEPKNVNGGAVAYDVDNDTFLYCKKIDARMLTLASFSNQIDEAFATAHTLHRLLLHAQEDIGPRSIPAEMSIPMNFLPQRKLS